MASQEKPARWRISLATALMRVSHMVVSLALAVPVCKEVRNSLHWNSWASMRERCRVEGRSGILLSCEGMELRASLRSGSKARKSQDWAKVVMSLVMVFSKLSSGDASLSNWCSTGSEMWGSGSPSRKALRRAVTLPDWKTSRHCCRRGTERDCSVRLSSSGLARRYPSAPEIMPSTTEETVSTQRMESLERLSSKRLLKRTTDWKQSTSSWCSVKMRLLGTRCKRDSYGSMTTSI